jgi:hypothetical protein
VGLYRGLSSRIDTGRRAIEHADEDALDERSHFVLQLESVQTHRSIDLFCDDHTLLNDAALVSPRRREKCPIDERSELRCVGADLGADPESKKLVISRDRCEAGVRTNRVTQGG